MYLPHCCTPLVSGFFVNLIPKVRVIHTNRHLIKFVKLMNYHHKIVSRVFLFIYKSIFSHTHKHVHAREISGTIEVISVSDGIITHGAQVLL